MARRKVRFIAVETVKKPITLTFRTKDGKLVTLKAMKAVKKPSGNARAVGMSPCPFVMVPGNSCSTNSRTSLEYSHGAI
jgi:hypothetical protein